MKIKKEIMNDTVDKLFEGNLMNMYNLSKEWIGDVEFYEEELRFLYSLISERIDTTTTEDLEHKDIFRHIDSLLFKLSEEVIEEMKLHKNELARLIDTKDFSGNHKESRKHLHLLEKMNRIKHGIKKLKMALFGYIKNHLFEFDFDKFFKEL